MKRTSPTARSLRYLRDRGIVAEKVEQRLMIPGRFVTRDLFNVFDVIACDRHAKRILGIQITSGSNAAARRQKMLAEPLAQAWKECGGLMVLHSWAKRSQNGIRGARKIWTLKEEYL